MKKILVIDDDDLVRNVMTKMLERAGFEVTTATNGREGVESYHNSPADLVITDLIMPEQDGIETIIQLKNMSEKCQNYRYFRRRPDRPGESRSHGLSGHCKKLWCRLHPQQTRGKKTPS